MLVRFALRLLVTAVVLGTAVTFNIMPFWLMVFLACVMGAAIGGSLLGEQEAGQPTKIDDRRDQ